MSGHSSALRVVRDGNAEPRGTVASLLARGRAALADGDLSAADACLVQALEHLGNPAPRRGPRPVSASSEPPDVPPLDLRLLGGDRVVRGTARLDPVRFSYAKPRELLFFLAEHGTADKARIGVALWPDSSPAELRGAFHTTLHHLRRAVGSSRVVHEHGHYRLSRTGLGYDVAAFRRALSDAWSAQSRAAEYEALERARRLYGGDYWPNGSALWVTAVRDDLRTDFERVLLAMGRMLQAAGGHARATDVYRQLLRSDALSEQAHRELMTCYAALGEPARALRQYETLAALLDAELGLRPSPATQTVRERLLRTR